MNTVPPTPSPEVDVSDSILIDGLWEEGEDGAETKVSPITEEEIASVGNASARQVDAAVRAARRAQPGWRRHPAYQRGALVRAIASVLEENREDLATLLTHEVGKPLQAARGEVDFAIRYAAYMAEWDRRVEGEILPSDHISESIHLLRQPLGVVAAITAWNFPVALYVRKVAPALVTGNTVVIKPSEVTPLASILLTRLISDRVELPAGVLNLVTGGRETGRAMVSHPEVDLIAMTGHRDSGKAIMAAAAGNLTRVSLELGGKAPAIVLADSDIGLAVRELVDSRHANSGQVCTCAERTFVEGTILNEFVERYTAEVRKLRVGDPWTDVDLGPLISERQLEKTTSLVSRAREAGATVIHGGARPDGEVFQRGYWYQPTVLVDVDPSMEIMREETFGPVMPITRIDSLEEGMHHANDSRYGLSAYLYTSNYQNAMRAAEEINFGELYINRSHGEQPQAHHIGWRESGIGGEDGKYGVLKYTQLKTIYHRFG